MKTVAQNTVINAVVIAHEWPANCYFGPLQWNNVAAAARLAQLEAENPEFWETTKLDFESSCHRLAQVIAANPSMDAAWQLKEALFKHTA